MALLSEQVSFLPAGTELLVSVNPDREIAPELLQHLERVERVEKPRRDYYVRIRLLDELKINFCLHESGRISREFESCRCFIPALPQENIRSLNQAYQRISAAFEPSRTSVGGRVYDNVFYLEKDGFWMPLEVRRETLFKPFRERFEKEARKLDTSEKEIVSGVRLPVGNCLLFRETTPQPSLFFPSDVSDILEGAVPFAKYQNLVSFGPFDEETLWRYIQCLEASGRHYGVDFVHFNNALPEWCRLLVLSV